MKQPRLSKEAITELSDDILNCIVRRVHAMYTVEDITQFTPAPFGYLLPFRCWDCGTVRRDIVNFRGEVLSRHYDHPDSYRELKRKFEAGDLRIELLRRHGVVVQRPRKVS